MSDCTDASLFLHPDEVRVPTRGGNSNQRPPPEQSGRDRVPDRLDIRNSNPSEEVIALSSVCLLGCSKSLAIERRCLTEGLFENAIQSRARRLDKPVVVEREVARTVAVGRPDDAPVIGLKL